MDLDFCENRPFAAFRVFVVLLLVLASGCDRQRAAPAETLVSKPVSIKVTCAVNFSGRAENFQAELELPEGATAFDALLEIAGQKRLEVKSRGSDETRFVLAIGSTENEGAGGDNWIYRVDGKLGDCSSGIFELKNGQNLVWSLGVYP